MLLAAASIATKVIYYASALSPTAGVDPRVTAQLIAGGWTPAVGGGQDGGEPRFTIQFAGCPRPIEAAIFARSSEIDGAFALAAASGDSVFYLYRGKVSAQVPRWALWRERAGDLGRSLRVVSQPVSPVVGVIIPAGCIATDRIVPLVVGATAMSINARDDTATRPAA